MGWHGDVDCDEVFDAIEAVEEVLSTHGDDLLETCLQTEKEVCSDVILKTPATLSENLRRGSGTLYPEWQCVACLRMNGEPY